MEMPTAGQVVGSSVAFPVVTGTLVTRTASATGVVPPYTFQYWVFDGTTWHLERDWNTSASWTWEAPLVETPVVWTASWSALGPLMVLP